MPPRRGRDAGRARVVVERDELVELVDERVGDGEARWVRRGVVKVRADAESQFMDRVRGPTSTARFFARRSDLRRGVLDQSIGAAVDGEGDGDGRAYADGAGRDDCGDGDGRAYADGAGRDGDGRDCDGDGDGRDADDADAERLARYALPDSYALCTFLNFAVARSRFACDLVAYLSGWYLSASFLYARRTLFSVALSALTPRT